MGSLLIGVQLYYCSLDDFLSELQIKEIILHEIHLLQHTCMHTCKVPQSDLIGNISSWSFAMHMYTPPGWDGSSSQVTSPHSSQSPIFHYM